MKPDLLILQPIDIDYPFFRYNLARYRAYFNQVIIVLMGNRAPLAPFLFDVYRNEQFVVPMDAQATVSNLMQLGLEKVQSDKIIFWDQQFLIKDERLFEVLLAPTQDQQVVLYTDEKRVPRPAFFYATIHRMNSTVKNFDANGQVHGLFGQFFSELRRTGEVIDLEDLTLHNKEDFYWAEGLNNLYRDDRAFTSHKESNEALTLNHYSLQLPVAYDKKFKAYMEKTEEVYLFEESEADDLIESFFRKGGVI